MALAFFEGNVFSQSLGMTTGIAISLPADMAEPPAQGMPVLTVLHGLSDNHSNWYRRTNIDRYAEQAGIAVVMPEVQRGFYTDMRYGLRYFTYIAEELPLLCRRMFRFSDRPEDNYIAGFSMGGYGALKTALTHPDRYAAVGAFSSVADIRNTTIRGGAEYEAIFGEGPGPEEDIFYLSSAAAQKNAHPRLYLACGDQDFLLEDNRRLHAHMEAVGLPHKYEEWAGDHNWEFWDTAIQKYLSFVGR